MAHRPRRPDLIAIGKAAEESYDRVEHALGRVRALASPTLAEVDARIGRPIWRAIADARGVSARARYPEASVLAAIGRKATLTIDSADRGRMGGSDDDAYAVIGGRLWDLATQEPEAAAEPAPSMGGT